MTSLVSDGSPRVKKTPSKGVGVLDKTLEIDRIATRQVTPSSMNVSMLQSKSPSAGATSKLPVQSQPQNSKVSAEDARKISTGMEDILAKLRLNDSRNVTPTNIDTAKANEAANFDKIISGLNQQTKALKQQDRELKDDSHKSSDQSSASGQYTESYGMVSSSTTSRGSEQACLDAAEMLRVKQELEAARSVISRQEKELAETRTFKHTMDQAMGPPSEIDYGQADISEQAIGHLQSAFNASARPFTSKNQAWRSPEDARSDSDFSAASFNPRGGWNQTAAGLGLTDLGNQAGLKASQAYAAMLGSQGFDIDNFGPGRSLSGSSSSFGYNPRLNDMAMFGMNPSGRRDSQFRSNSTLSDTLPLAGLPGIAGLNSPPLSPLAIPEQYAYAQRSLGLHQTPVSPEFPNVQASNAWSVPPNANDQTYVTPLEPLNYRRLLDKSVSCDWKYIVDKIVCNNDQQASIFLQQKLKVGTAEQKFEIVESIVNQAYPLMINRFGNFLVQRCFEHGTPEQVVAIANAIHGNVIALSMDPFGCHVIQKAFDSVPEDHKADMVRELLRRIPDTVIHRYACHVWQKLFELRWSGEPPQIMVKVNEALRGMWHEVALGETGSLVVQNIFENCVEEEKRPAIEEVISNIDLIAHGQFGNWCIQHLCEHGSPPDKRRVVDHILANSYNYSIDQFASKVVEKCLKIGGLDFLDRYLGVITTARPDRPRIPLIDIAGDQYGNYLIQWILMNAHHHQREQVAVHIRKHMVSLRGSKFGSRVAMLCCNPNSVTRPGPPSVAGNPYGAPGQPRNNWAPRGFR